MEGERVNSSLDLSHLTEEEKTSILHVLQRDLELRDHDAGRVRSVRGDFCLHYGDQRRFGFLMVDDVKIPMFHLYLFCKFLKSPAWNV